MFHMCALTLTAILLTSSTATAQRKVSWTRDVQAAVAKSKQTKLPLMFLIEGDSRERDQRLDDERRKAMLDDRVVYAARRFIPVIVVRSDSRQQDLFRRLQVPASANMDVVFSTPDGEKIDTFSALHQPDTFAQKMTLVFNAYRDQFYKQELKGVIDDPTNVANTIKALKFVEAFTIESADRDVVKLLEKASGNPRLKQQAMETLAALSTEPAVEALWKEALLGPGESGRAAAKALEKITPAAAERVMRQGFNSGDPRELVLAYNVVTAACSIKDAKPDRFWEGDNQRVQKQELERVTRIVENKAQRWRDTFGRYR